MAGNADPVDATDARLLLALADDPRASVMALSQRLRLARNTVQTRLTRLESNGVLAPLDRRGRPRPPPRPRGAAGAGGGGPRRPPPPHPRPPAPPPPRPG